MQNNISPNFPWQKWPHRQYLLSRTRARLSLVERGAFADLKDIAATQTPFGSIPNDDFAIAGWLMISIKQWLKIKAKVLTDWLFDDDRYFLPMLIDIACNQEESHTAAEAQPVIKQPRKSKKTKEEISAVRAEAARASQEKRRANKDAQKQNSNLQIANDLQNSNLQIANDLQNSNLQIAKTANYELQIANDLQNGGIKGGDLDSDLEEKLKQVVVSKDFLTNESAHAITPPTTTTKFSMFFDFQIQTANFDLLMQKFNVAQSKNTADNLTNFVGHYLGSSYQNTQAEWELHYVKWLKREKDKPVASVATPEATPNKTPVPLVIVDVKPLWETIAEQKAQREAIPPKDPQKLAAADSALTEMKKKLGLKAA